MSYAVGDGQTGEIYNAYLSRGRAKNAASKDPSLRVWDSDWRTWMHFATAPPVPFITLIVLCVFFIVLSLAMGG